MPSPFAAALAKADVKIDGLMGETILVTPMKAGDFDNAFDPERPPFDVVALVNDTDPSAADVAKLEARFGYEEFDVEIRRELLTGRVIRKNDQVLLLERRGPPRFKVSRIDDNDLERIGLTLTRLAPED